MKESNLNTIISNSFNNYINSKCTKIPDPIQGRGIQLPCDYFGSYNGIPLYGESKLIKSNLNAWNFKNTVEEHQFENLHFYANQKVETLSIYTIGYYVPRQLKIVFVFDSEFVYNELKKGITTFKKPTIMNWYKNNKFLYIKKDLLQDLHLLKEKIIYGY